jgi:S-adenosylmethionine/arginine decarboxylase-like enzyme
MVRKMAKTAKRVRHHGAGTGAGAATTSAGATSHASDVIQHHHFLLRMETRSCPSAADKEAAADMLRAIVADIDMELLGEPRVYYVTLPHYNEGLTALAPIQTSHIAFHFWKTPDRAILHSPKSNCLLEFDIYTCGSLNTTKIHKALTHLSAFEPTHVDATILNRKWSLAIEKHMQWNGEKSTWSEWLAHLGEGRDL